MFPYQVSKVLADQHIHDMVATASRRRRVQDEPSSRLKVMTARITQKVALLSGRPGAGSRSTATSVSNAGPMGCSA